MRPLFSLPLLLLFLFAAFTKTSAQKAEEDAIKKVIQQETSTFFHKNYDGWLDTWAHDSADYMIRVGTTYNYQLMGWNAIAAEYKQSMQGLSTMSDADIAPYLNKTDYNVYVNGNIATVTFKEGNGTPSNEARTMVKQNGSWKILNMTIIDNNSYNMLNALNNIKALAGKWELDGSSFTNEPANSTQLKTARFELRETPNGLEQLSDAVFSNNNQTFAAPTEYEYFVPDNNTGGITYMDIQKNTSGQTSTLSGKVTSDQPNSFTVTAMYPDDPKTMQYQYTVTLQGGKWHQVAKFFGRDGKQSGSATFDMHRM